MVNMQLGKLSTLCWNGPLLKGSSENFGCGMLKIKNRSAYGISTIKIIVNFNAGNSRRILKKMNPVQRTSKRMIKGPKGQLRERLQKHHLFSLMKGEG